MTTVLIISALTLSIAVTIALLGTNEVIRGFESGASQIVLQKADGCLEEAQYRLKLDASYSGGTIPYADGTCTITIAGAGSSRTITSTITIGKYTRTIGADITLTSNIAGD